MFIFRLICVLVLILCISECLNAISLRFRKPKLFNSNKLKKHGHHFHCNHTRVEEIIHNVVFGSHHEAHHDSHHDSHDIDSSVENSNILNAVMEKINQDLENPNSRLIVDEKINTNILKDNYIPRFDANILPKPKNMEWHQMHLSAKKAAQRLEMNRELNKEEEDEDDNESESDAGYKQGLIFEKIIETRLKNALMDLQNFVNLGAKN